MTAPAIGDRFLFRSNHMGVAELTGQPCTLVEIYDESIQWPYAVRFDGGQMSVAVDCELLPIAADGSVGERLTPAPGSRKGWDGYQTMLKHSPARYVAQGDGSVIAPEQLIAALVETTV